MKYTVCNLQGMYNHMVGRVGSIPSPLDSMLLEETRQNINFCSPLSDRLYLCSLIFSSFVYQDLNIYWDRKHKFK